VAFHRLSIPLGAALGILILKEKFYTLKLLGVLIMLVGLLGVALG
jgi:multidrug transporter EmrE-like cation transporter